MAYYDALTAKWATLSGMTTQKLSAINALTVPGPAVPCFLAPTQIVNAIVPADLAALSGTYLQILLILLSGASVNASVGTTVRIGVQTIFTGKTTTLSQLGALVAPFDNPQVPWWQAAVANNGGGLSAPVSQTDLDAVGLS